MENRLQDPDAFVEKASAFVYTLFKEKLPDTILYHSFGHTVEVAKEAVRIGEKTELDAHGRMLVALAAWFHDTGFTETYDGHEEASARIARDYLRDDGLPEADVEQVVELIRSTHADREPQTLAEEILHDADLAHVGKKRKFFEFSERLRREWEVHRDRTYSDQEWAEVQLAFLSGISFRTRYAQERFDETKDRNLRKVKEQLAAALDRGKAVPAPTDRGAPGRGIETMFRTAYRNHINLSAIADSKANIMISVNAILMSIIVSFISTRLQADPWLMIPATAMLITSLVAVVFAILSARPKVTSQIYSLEDVRRNRANILFFGNFVNLAQPEFRVGMKEIMADWDRLYDSMINDIYSLGQVLSRKYRLLWLSYTCFMAGLIVTVVLFLGLFFLG